MIVEEKWKIDTKYEPLLQQPPTQRMYHAYITHLTIYLSTNRSHVCMNVWYTDTHNHYTCSHVYSEHRIQTRAPIRKQPIVKKNIIIRWTTTPQLTLSFYVTLSQSHTHHVHALLLWTHTHTLSVSVSLRHRKQLTAYISRAHRYRR